MHLGHLVQHRGHSLQGLSPCHLQPTRSEHVFTNPAAKSGRKNVVFSRQIRENQRSVAARPLVANRCLLYAREGSAPCGKHRRSSFPGPSRRKASGRIDNEEVELHWLVTGTERARRARREECTDTERDTRTRSVSSLRDGQPDPHANRWVPSRRSQGRQYPVVGGVPLQSLRGERAGGSGDSGWTDNYQLSATPYCGPRHTSSRPRVPETSAAIQESCTDRSSHARSKRR